MGGISPACCSGPCGTNRQTDGGTTEQMGFYAGCLYTRSFSIQGSCLKAEQDQVLVFLLALLAFLCFLFLLGLQPPIDFSDFRGCIVHHFYLAHVLPSLDV